MKTVIAGGTGFLGTALNRHLTAAGWHVVILSRRPGPNAVIWDGRTIGPWAGQLDGADALVNLAGRSIACRHTSKNRQEILESRLDSVRVLHEAIGQCRHPPAVWVQASATGYYGDAGDRICDETAPPGTDFLASVVSAWEEDFQAQCKAPVVPRKVALRTGFVLSREGGGFPPLLNLARAFLGGSAGNGRQYLSWIHLADWCAACRWALERPASSGAYNLTAPAPTPNAEFMRELRHALGRPWSPPAPAWAIKVAANVFAGIDPSLILTGARCLPHRLLAEGFSFRFPDLRPALLDLLR